MRTLAFNLDITKIDFYQIVFGTFSVIYDDGGESIEQSNKIDWFSSMKRAILALILIATMMLRMVVKMEIVVIIVQERMVLCLT